MNPPTRPMREQAVLENISIGPIPEPSVLALLGLGIVMLGAAVSRRHRI